MRFSVYVFALCGIFCLAQEQTAARLPYKTVDHPDFVPAARASFAGESDRVIGVMDGRTAKAYLAADLAQHGVVQDRLSSGPIAVTW